MIHQCTRSPDEFASSLRAEKYQNLTATGIASNDLAPECATSVEAWPVGLTGPLGLPRRVPARKSTVSSGASAITCSPPCQRRIEYRDIILPMTVVRRLDGVLNPPAPPSWRGKRNWTRRAYRRPRKAPSSIARPDKPFTIAYPFRSPAASRQANPEDAEGLFRGLS